MKKKLVKLTTRKLAKKWAKKKDVPTPVRTSYPVNDTERAQRFAKKCANELKYIQAWKRWLLWNGVRWVPDEDGAVFRKAQEIPRLLQKEAAEIEDDDKRKKAFVAAIRAGDRSKLEAMIKLAECQPGIAASPTLFDSDRWLLGVANGVVDLRTGEFREARKEDYITKQAGVAYDPAATCHLWEKFLLRVFAGDAELISFIQRAVGYTLTGEILEQCLFFPYGTGQNGKSTFIESMHQLMGTYAVKASPALYTLNRWGTEPEAEIARLKGTRLATGSETEEGARLAEARVKDSTGGDTLTGRELYGHPFNFSPTHKLWIYGNHLPDIRGNDDGIWRRIKLIPFEVKKPDEAKDPKLPEKLLKELPGILNWAIRGCLEWQKRGLGTPATVIEATTEYREEEDEIGEFIGEKCTCAGQVERSDLHDAYREWAEGRGVRMPMTTKAFAKRLRVRPGISELKSNGRRYWNGISLLAVPHRISFRMEVSPPGGSKQDQFSRDTGHVGQQMRLFA
jgi:putative DNA primase/helicase